jgi:hypothetical protein
MKPPKKPTTAEMASDFRANRKATLRETPQPIPFVGRPLTPLERVQFDEWYNAQSGGTEFTDPITGERKRKQPWWKGG